MNQRTFLLVMLLFCKVSCFAQPANTGTLQGYIKDTSGSVLSGASVFVHDVRTGAIADGSGHYLTSPIRPGRYLVEVTYQGYATLTQPVVIKGPTQQNFTLHPTAVEQEAVTVTGVSSATRLKASAQAVSLVKQSELLQNANTNVINALARKGGVSVIATGPAISKPVIRGLGYNRVVTINDGIRQEGQQWGDEHGIEIDEFSVQKAEILKGPASLIYGSDAIAGVINLISNQPVATGTIKGNILTAYNTNNRSRAINTSFAGHVVNGFNWNAYGTLESAGDYRNKWDGIVLNSRFAEKNFGGYIGLNKPWGYTHLLLSNFNQRLGLTEGLRDSATGQFLIFPEAAFAAIATKAQLESRTPTIPYQQVNHFRIASDNNFLIGGNRVAATLAFQRNQRKEFGDPEQPGTADLYFDLKTLSYRVQWQLSQQAGIKTTLGANGMYQQNRNLASEKLIPEYGLFDAGLFVYATKTIDRVNLSGGLRGDLRHMQLHALSEGGVQKFQAVDNQFANISGSIGAAFEATKALTIKANFAKGFRAPNAAELGSNGAHEGTYRYEIGNAGLKTENSLQADAGLELVTRHISFGINAYYNHIGNYIYYSRLSSATGADSIINDNGTPLQAFKFNQSAANLAGFEANFDIHPHPLDWLHIENTFSFVAGNFNRSFEGTKNLPAMPAPHLLTEVRADVKNASKHFKNFYFKTEADVYARQSRVFTAYNTETVTPGYTLINIGTGTDVFVAKRTVFSIYLALNNAFDKAYQNHLSRLKYTDINNLTGRPGVYNMGRNFNIKLIVPFKFQ